ncbi:aminotransferase class I/II-fold pyridoxal phosphate-dependent enzyme [Salimicrobium humidisoli]|nr:aminotransferase class I/II-fold pyridoxal phosphate-dependent enzyme [Salimicrobium humidisoli]
MTRHEKAPLWEAVKQYRHGKAGSYHVPGHKNGTVFDTEAREVFRVVLEMDATEIPGLDDLHSPRGAIKEAEELARLYFKSEKTRFLVNGSTSGNLAMILAVCRRGSPVLVQRNAHKSILHGIELAGAKPVFLAPEWDARTGKFSSLTPERVREGLRQFPEAVAVIVTYPDYFGHTFNLSAITSLVHEAGKPVLVDEAHGVHFSLHRDFPDTALAAGADIVVQSAHKMAPAMTMGAYLHTQGPLVPEKRLSYMLQVVQSSSPSYPVMVSLDLCRRYMAMWKEDGLLTFLDEVREELDACCDGWEVLPASPQDDPLKVELKPRRVDGFTLASMLEEQGIYAEMATNTGVLLTFGLERPESWENDKVAFYEVARLLQKREKHDKIIDNNISFPPVQQLDAQYEEMEDLQQTCLPLENAVGHIAAEAVIPYPPGIPLILKGERIRQEQVEHIRTLIENKAVFQNENIEKAVTIFQEEWS